MTWTAEKVSQVPEVYRDFMLLLRPVLDSRAPGTLLRITGIPVGMIASSLREEHGYSSEQVSELARNLKRAGLVEEDHLGFFVPTARGEAFINTLVGRESVGASQVPPFPNVGE